MQADVKSRWLDVCAEAAICDNAQRLAQLATEIIAILHKEERLLEARPLPNRVRA